MKRKIILISLMLAIFTAFICINACSGSDADGDNGLLDGITFKDATFTYDGTEKSIYISGELPKGITVTYEGNGKTVAGVHAVTAKFWRNGEYISEADMIAQLRINKAKHDMSGITFGNKTVIYNGEEHSLMISGELPEGVSVSYSRGAVSDIGEYIVTATFTVSDPNYAPVPSMNAKLKIIVHPLQGISFSDGEFTYDGSERSIFVSGELPSDVRVIYEGNGKTDAGTYTVSAIFESDNPDYGELPPVNATLKINKAVYTPVFNSAEVDFDGTEKSLYITGELPDGICVSYKGNGTLAVGEHTVYAEFSGSNKNYEAIMPVSAVLTVNVGSFFTPELTFAKRTDGTYEVTAYAGNGSAVMIPSVYDGKEVTSVKSGAFKDNAALKYVYIPDSVTNIGNNAFSGSGLNEMRLSERLSVIGIGTFENTELKNAVLPDSLTSIGRGAFEGCPMESITVPFVGGSHVSSNEHIGFIFGAATYVANAEYIPTTLKTVTLSNACQKIPAYSFWGCSGVENVVIGSGVKKIENSAFRDCVAIKSIYVPKTVTDIYASEHYYDSPFYGVSDELMVVLESSDTSGFGQYFANISAEQRALVVYGKTYSDYLENSESFRVVDMTTAELYGIFVGGAMLSDFSVSKLAYSVALDFNAPYKRVSATPISNGTVITVTQASADTNGIATVTATSGDGKTVKTYKITFNLTGTPKAEVVNKDGTDGVVTYVIDDGDHATASFATSMLDKYSNLSFSFGVWTKDFATLKTEDKNSDGIPEYVMNNGKYTYDVNQSNVEFWTGILAKGRSEIVSHTHTHEFWGTNDNGGSFKYVKSNGTVVTSGVMPKGSATKELAASKQIIEELFPSYLSPSGKALGLIIPGISVKTVDYVANGEVIRTYNTYFNQLMANAQENDELISARGTFGVTNTVDSASYVTTATALKNKENRLNIPAFMINYANAGANGIENWTAYIDHAIDQNGWACFCIHYITDDNDTSTGWIQTFKSQAEELFAYSDGKNVCVATYTEASLYYNEWSTSKVTASFEDSKLKVTLTDKEEDSVYNMALTVKVTVPAVWESAKVGNDTLEVHKNADGTSYVYVNIVPDSGTVEIVEG